MRQWHSVLMLTIVSMLQLACSTSSVGGKNDRVLFLLGEEFDPQEFWGPYAALCAAGYTVDLAGAQKGVELTPDSPLPEANIRTNISLDEVDVSKYFALVVPGGPSAANVARFPKAGEIATRFNAAGKLIGTVCHGARLLMPQGIFKNRPTTAIFMVADELCDQWKAGDYGMYLDLPVVLDQNLLCSRDPRDVPAMAEALIDRFAESGGLPVATREARVLIVLPAATPHQRWVFDRLSIFGITPVVWNEGQELNADSFDMLVILDGAGAKPISSQSLTAMVDRFRQSKKTVLISDGARKSLPGLAAAKVIHADNIAYVMKQIVESSPQARSAEKTAQRIALPDSRQWASNYAAAAATPIKGAPWNPVVEYDAVLALWNGYDDYAATRVNDFLARMGRHVLIAGPHKGTLTGLNGSKAEIVATYEDRIKLSSSAIVVAPGGVWPIKTKAQQAEQPKWVEDDEPARRRRLDFLTTQYKSGRMLVAFGFDSLHIGQQPLFKGKHFASTDQASVIWFGSDGAEYSPEKAMFSARNLLTAKPLVGVDAAINLLQEYLTGKSSGSPSGNGMR